MDRPHTLCWVLYREQHELTIKGTREPSPCPLNGNHVSVLPPGGQMALKDWQSSYENANADPHEFTLLLHSLLY